MSRKGIVRATTIEKLKSGQAITLYSHYSGIWDDKDSRFLVYYKAPEYPTMPPKLIGIIPVDLDADGVPVLDTKRLPVENNKCIPIIKKYVFALFGVALEKDDFEEGITMLDGVWALKPSQIRALKGATIHGKHIKGIIIEELDDGSVKYLFRTQDGIVDLKDVFHTTKLIYLED